MNSAVQVSEDKERLREILEKHEYTVYNRPESSSFWDWVKSLLRKLMSYFPEFHLSQGTGDVLTIGFLLILLGVAAYAIYWFSRQIIRQKRIRSAAYLPEGEMSRSYRDYWRQAAEFRAAGNWREGVRAAFLSLLFYLEASRSIRVEKWKTNWEYADELAGTEPALVPLFQDSSLVFERIWYGKADVTEEQFAFIYDRVTQVMDREGGSHERAE